MVVSRVSKGRWECIGYTPGDSMDNSMFYIDSHNLSLKARKLRWLWYSMPIIVYLLRYLAYIASYIDDRGLFKGLLGHTVPLPNLR